MKQRMKYNLKDRLFLGTVKWVTQNMTCEHKKTFKRGKITVCWNCGSILSPNYSRLLTWMEENRDIIEVFLGALVFSILLGYVTGWIIFGGR